MDFIEFKMWKLGALAGVAFLWGIYCGFTGRDLTVEQPDTPPSQP